MYRAQWSKTKKYYDARQEEARRRRDVPDHHRPVEVQGLRRVRDGVRRRRPEDDRQDRRDHGQGPQEPPLSSRTSGRANEKYISDNLLIDMMLKEQTHIYTGGAGSCAGCGEGTALRMMCAATGIEVRRPVGHRRGDRLQHGVHLDVPVQPVPGAVDELAVRERPDLRHRRADALGPDGLEGQAAVGASAATGRCSTSASRPCRGCSPAA